MCLVSCHRFKTAHLEWKQNRSANKTGGNHKQKAPHVVTSASLHPYLELEATSNKCIATSNCSLLVAMPLLLVAMHLLLVPKNHPLPRKQFHCPLQQNALALSIAHYRVQFDGCADTVFLEQAFWDGLQTTFTVNNPPSTQSTKTKQTCKHERVGHPTNGFFHPSSTLRSQHHQVSTNTSTSSTSLWTTMPEQHGFK